MNDGQFFLELLFIFVSFMKAVTFSHIYFQRVYMYWENALITNLTQLLLTTPERT